MASPAYIVDCVRTAAGRRKGRLSKWHPADLGAAVIDGLVNRVGMSGSLVDDVIMGCVSQYGAQTANLCRTSVLASKKLPLEVPGVTVDRQCGSGQQAIHFAAQAVMSGTQDVVIAAGVESMSLVPIGSPVLDGIKYGRGNPYATTGIQDKYGKGVMFSQFKGAELLAKEYQLTREEIDEFSHSSHIKAGQATKKGVFSNEIVPLQGTDRKTGEVVLHDKDEGIRYNPNLAKMKCNRHVLTNSHLLTVSPC